MKNNSIPSFLKPFLWSADLNKLDKKKHKSFIIKNILNYGDEQAVRWLQHNYKERQKPLLKSLFAQSGVLSQ